MKKFFTRIVIFFGVLITYFLLNGIINYYFISVVPSGISASGILIVGDSHPAVALDPKAFRNANNIAQAAEPYPLSLWKLQKALEVATPDTVIIGFSPYAISGINDWKFRHRHWSSEMFIRTYPIKKFEIDEDAQIDAYGYYRMMWSRMCLYPHQDHVSHKGTFTPLEGSLFVEVNATIQRHFYLEGKFQGVSERMLRYLDLLVRLCKVNDIVPVLINCPVHKSYLESIPSLVKTRFELSKRRYQQEGVLVLDFAASHYPDSLYYNWDHLNRLGSQRLSNEVKALFRGGHGL